jgi:hypothetical protein
MALRLVPLGKPLDSGAEADGKLGCFHRGPLQRRVAIFDVALACPLPMADCGTLHTAAIRGVITHGGKTTHIARFQHNRLSHNRPNAIDGLQLLVGGCGLQPRMHELFQGVDLLPQAVQNGQTAGDCQDVIRLRQQALDLLQGQRVHPLGTEAYARIPYDDVLQTEPSRGLLAHQVRAFAQDIPHSPLSFWVDVPLGQHAQP